MRQVAEPRDTAARDRPVAQKRLLAKDEVHGVGVRAHAATDRVTPEAEQACVLRAGGVWVDERTDGRADPIGADENVSGLPGMVLELMRRSIAISIEELAHIRTLPPLKPLKPLKPQRPSAG
jgi:hypothetical protein